MKHKKTLKPYILSKERIDFVSSLPLTLEEAVLAPDAVRLALCELVESAESDADSDAELVPEAVPLDANDCVAV
jgi:hypothetical protein